MDHLGLLEPGDDLVLSLIEGHEEHVYVLETCRLLVKLRLEYAVVHQVNSCHPSYDHVGRLVRRHVPMMSYERSLRLTHHRRVNEAHVGHGAVPTGADASVLIEGVRLVHGRRLGGGWLPHAGEDALW